MDKQSADIIRVIAYREGDQWVAQCLEYDIAAQGPDFQEAMLRLTMTVNAECEYTLKKHGKAFESIDAAPQEFFEKFEQTDFSMRSDHMELKIAA